ncbi:MAG: sel1 repeat family protein [Bacteroidales bacterium]|nr:sel1 repeat family protein [Bacteroidales bacterium]
MCKKYICYFRGCGVKQNKEKAREWFEKAAVQGNRNAKYALEEYYY